MNLNCYSVLETLLTPTHNHMMCIRNITRSVCSFIGAFPPRICRCLIHSFLPFPTVRLFHQRLTWQTASTLKPTYLRHSKSGSIAAITIHERNATGTFSGGRFRISNLGTMSFVQWTPAAIAQQRCRTVDKQRTACFNSSRYIC